MAAPTRRVSVLLERRPEPVLLLVEDDGQGFDAEAALGAPDPRGSFGNCRGYGAEVPAATAGKRAGKGSLIETQ